MNVVDFAYNYNNKLRCRCFTSIRLRNDEKYHKGAVFEIQLLGWAKGKAKIVGISYLTIDKISEWIARLDTGYSAKETKDLIKKMYKDNPLINWKTQELVYVLFAWENQEKMDNLFKD